MKLSGKLWIEVPDGAPRSLPPGRYKAGMKEISLTEYGVGAWLHVKAPTQLGPLQWQPATLSLIQVNGEWQGFLGRDQFPVGVLERK